MEGNCNTKLGFFYWGRIRSQNVYRHLRQKLSLDLIHIQVRPEKIGRGRLRFVKFPNFLLKVNTAFLSRRQFLCFTFLRQSS